MKNIVLVVDADSPSSTIQSKINEKLNEGWLVELFYEARGQNSNKIIITLYKEESAVG